MLVPGEGTGRLSDGEGAAPGRRHIHLSPCRQLLSYITKDKQTETLVEKLCQRFRTARYAAHPPAGLFAERSPKGKEHHWGCAGR